MQDIRLVGNDGEYLNLETQAGDKFRLVLDDSLRAAVKRDSSVQLDSVAFSPRAIQDAVRGGLSALEIAEKHSIPLDYVDKFAQTVIDEIGHIIASAQSVRIAIAADRYSDATQLEFGEVIASRIASAGGSSLQWSAGKIEGSPWQVTVTYVSNNTEISAVWSFDQRKLILSPENEAAVKLSAGELTSHAPAPKLRAMEEADSTVVIELPTQIEAPPALSVVSPIEQLTRSSVLAAEAQAKTIDMESGYAADETLSETADLLEALRRKRANKIEESTGSSLQKKVSSDEVTVSVSTESESSLEAEVDAEVEVVLDLEAAPVIPTPKKGRPSMPSWDEIVFGTKTDD